MIVTYRNFKYTFERSHRRIFSCTLIKSEYLNGTFCTVVCAVSELTVFIVTPSPYRTVGLQRNGEVFTAGNHRGCEFIRLSYINRKRAYD